MGYTTIPLFMKLMFALFHFHKWDMKYIEECYPWERDVFVGMLEHYLSKENGGNEEAAMRAAAEQYAML